MTHEKKPLVRPVLLSVSKAGFAPVTTQKAQ